MWMAAMSTIHGTPPARASRADVHRYGPTPLTPAGPRLDRHRPKLEAAKPARASHAPQTLALDLYPTYTCLLCPSIIRPCAICGCGYRSRGPLA